MKKETDLEKGNLFGKVASMTEFTFGPENEDLVALGSEKTHFNPAGNSILWEVFNSNEQLVKTLTKKYTADQVLTEEILQQTDGKYFSQNSYAADGNLSEKQYDYGQGIVYKEMYDTDGNIIKSFENDIAIPLDEDINEDPYNEQWETKESLDSLGRKVKTTYYSSFNRLFDITQTVFDKNERLLEEKVFASEEELEKSHYTKMNSYTYDAFGNLVKRETNNKSANGDSWITIYTYTYRYDSLNNWVEKREVMNNKITNFKDKLQFVRKRTFQYID
jgi:hypothetical protein